MKLIGVREAAAILGWTPAKVSTYFGRGKMPEPIERLASGPVWTEAQIKAYKEMITVSEYPILVQVLAHELIRIFGAWVGTPSEDLLEDGGTVIDWLKNDSRAIENIDDIPEEYWDAAWRIFDEATGRMELILREAKERE